MEFNLEENRVIGLVDKRLGVDSASIKVLAYIDTEKNVKKLNEEEASKLFPHIGNIFEPGFFLNNSQKESDLISFFAQDNDQVKANRDHFRINHHFGNVNNFGIPAFYLRGFKKEGYHVDLSRVVIDLDNYNGDFYGITDKYFIGKLRIHKGVISPSTHKRVSTWDRDDSNILEYNETAWLIKEPEGEVLLLDCMDDAQLFDWFRDKLKLIDPDYVGLLDGKAKWRKEIPKILSKTDFERNEVDKVRFKRISEKLEYIDFSIDEIKKLSEASDKLLESFNKSIEKHKLELKLGYQKEIDLYQSELDKEKDQYRSELDKEKKRINKEKDDIELKVEKSKVEMNLLREEIENSIEKIAEIEKNKDRILKDFSIIKEVFGSTISNNEPNVKKSIYEESYLVEYIEKDSTADIISLKENYETRLQYHLNKHGIGENYATQLLNVLTIYRGVLIGDIRLGLAFIEACGNAKYIIKEVEPDWLHFKDFWINGLGTIWQSAHDNPDQLHFLLLEDINLSSPEIYARPLVDMVSGIRKIIPFGKSAYPENLKILGTIAPTNDPEIGLPFNKETFAHWGAIGLQGNIYNNNNSEEVDDFQGYISTNELNQFKPEDFEIGQIKNLSKSDFDNYMEMEQG